MTDAAEVNVAILLVTEKSDVLKNNRYQFNLPYDIINDEQVE